MKGFLTLLQILFIGLKLAHVVDWSWWLVLSPYISAVGIVAALLALAVVGSAWADKRFAAS